MDETDKEQISLIYFASCPRGSPRRSHIIECRKNESDRGDRSVHDAMRRSAKNEAKGNAQNTQHSSNLYSFSFLKCIGESTKTCPFITSAFAFSSVRLRCSRSRRSALSFESLICFPITGRSGIAHSLTLKCLLTARPAEQCSEHLISAAAAESEFGSKLVSEPYRNQQK